MYSVRKLVRDFYSSIAKDRSARLEPNLRWLCVESIGMTLQSSFFYMALFLDWQLALRVGESPL
jgi:hypothetical protein